MKIHLNYLIILLYSSFYFSGVVRGEGSENIKNIQLRELIIQLDLNVFGDLTKEESDLRSLTLDFSNASIGIYPDYRLQSWVLSMSTRKLWNVQEFDNGEYGGLIFVQVMDPVEEDMKEKSEDIFHLIVLHGYIMKSPQTMLITIDAKNSEIKEQILKTLRLRNDKSFNKLSRAP